MAPGSSTPVLPAGETTVSLGETTVSLGLAQQSQAPRSRVINFGITQILKSSARLRGTRMSAREPPDTLVGELSADSLHLQTWPR